MFAHKVIAEVLERENKINIFMLNRLNCWSFFNSFAQGGLFCENAILCWFTGNIFFCELRHINTVELQMEVTKFLHRCEKLGASSAAALAVPTLFGNNQMKMEVACKVMLEGKNIEEGFGIAFRVLQVE